MFEYVQGLFMLVAEVEDVVHAGVYRTTFRVCPWPCATAAGSRHSNEGETSIAKGMAQEGCSECCLPCQSVLTGPRTSSENLEGCVKLKYGAAHALSKGGRSSYVTIVNALLDSSAR